MRYFFISPDEVRKENPRISGAEARHMLQVLRLAPGHRIGLVDGTGRGYTADIVGITDSGVQVVIRAEFEAPRESPLEIVVAQALLKEKKMDRLVRQLTELGIAEWRPVASARSIPRLEGGRLAARLERWGKIAMEAVKQCRRGRTPDIHPPVSLAELLAMDLSCRPKVAFWEEASRPLDAIEPGDGTCRRILVLLGPEGGFSPEEMAAATGSGFVAVGLGPRILRAETATVAAVSLIQHRFGDMGSIAPSAPSSVGP